MLSRVMQRSLLRSSQQLTKMTKPGQYVCFCGCKDGLHFNNQLVGQQRRGFQSQLGLDSTQNLIPQEFKEADQVALWKELKS
mmetsp:Transcript_10202/g.17186  ORF Transcript_10202/g.17186 Transcript_10202/m.17186 type:complete len:82 (+) Transcript_10202:1359-1604(+)